MKLIKNVVLLALSCSALILSPLVLGSEVDKQQQAHNNWLKEQFSAQHQQLIPVVAVADMFYGCNKERKVDPIQYHISELVLKMDRSTLADKLSTCLAGDTLQSDIALNFGLYGCFNEQFSEMKPTEKKQKMKLVRQAINSLSREERKKSLTKCVTSQAIRYLQ